MSIEDDIARAFNDTIDSIRRLEDRVILLDRQLEVFAAALRHAGLITEEHIRQAKSKIKEEDEQLENSIRPRKPFPPEPLRYREGHIPR